MNTLLLSYNLAGPKWLGKDPSWTAIRKWLQSIVMEKIEHLSRSSSSCLGSFHIYKKHFYSNWINFIQNELEYHNNEIANIFWRRLWGRPSPNKMIESLFEDFWKCEVDMPEDIRVHCKELKEKIWNDPYMKEVYVKAPRDYWPHREPTDNADWFRYFYDHNIVERLLSPEYDPACFYYVHEDAHHNHMETNNRDYNGSIVHHNMGTNKDYNDSIVHHAATCGEVENLKNAIHCGADKNMKNSNGITPLHLACKYSQVKCVQVLIEFGDDVHVENYYKDTPLHYAAENGKEECVALLLENGASVTSKNLDDKTPICIARRENHDHILKLLKDVFL